MRKYKILYQTTLSEVHQQAALSSVPDILDVAIIRNPSKREMLKLIADRKSYIRYRSGMCREQGNCCLYSAD